jgi:hypothetical protein
MSCNALLGKDTIQRGGRTPGYLTAGEWTAGPDTGVANVSAEGKARLHKDPCANNGARKNSRILVVLVIGAGSAWQAQLWQFRLLFFILDPRIDLFPMYRDVLGGIDPNTHLVSLYAQDCDIDVVTDLQRFTDPAG